MKFSGSIVSTKGVIFPAGALALPAGISQGIMIKKILQRVPYERIMSCKIFMKSCIVLFEYTQFVTHVCILNL